jgi:hypothetical protein
MAGAGDAYRRASLQQDLFCRNLPSCSFVSIMVIAT